MRLGGILSVFSHILNLAIVVYITSAIIGTQCYTGFQLIITYIGLLASIIANIVSVLER